MKMDKQQFLLLMRALGFSTETRRFMMIKDDPGWHEQKRLEYELPVIETMARENGYDYPVAWALLWLYEYSGILGVLLSLDGRYREQGELEKIMDWIKHGDPEIRKEDK
ncbi:MAG: hypothetical protein ACXABN_17925 [Candidatus Thorarchaeota archaeon]|jgi:hypothetical protein